MHEGCKPVGNETNAQRKCAANMKRPRLTEKGCTSQRRIWHCHGAISAVHAATNHLPGRGVHLKKDAGRNERACSPRPPSGNVRRLADEEKQAGRRDYEEI